MKIINRCLLVQLLLLSLFTSSFSQWKRIEGPGSIGNSSFGVKGPYIFAGFNDIYRSGDDGKSWDLISTGWSIRHGFTSIGSTLYTASYGRGVYRSTDDGVTWIALNNGLQNAGGAHEAVAAMGDILFAATGGGVYRSTNNGASWTKQSAGITNSRYSSLYMTGFAVDGNTIFATSYGGGLFVSNDSGSTWSSSGTFFTPEICIGKSKFAENAILVVGDGHEARMACSTNKGVSWYYTSTYSVEDCRSVCYDGDIFFAASAKGVYVSNDGGKKWVITGLNDRYINKVGADPKTGYIFASSYQDLFISYDKGAHWKQVFIGPGGIVTALKQCKKDLKSFIREYKYCRTSNLGESWQSGGSDLATVNGFCSLDNELLVAGNGIHKLSMNGWGWTSTWNEQEDVYCITDLNRLLFAGTRESGVIVSTDMGSNWSASNAGLEGRYISAIGINSQRGALYVGCSGTVFESVDSGFSWNKIGLSGQDINTIHVVDSTIFVGTNRGIYRTSDAGKHWIQSNMGLTNSGITSIVSNNEILFAGTAGGGIFMSKDDGNRWIEINDLLTNKFITAMDITVPQSPGGEKYLVAGTWGDGIWKRSISELTSAGVQQNRELPLTFSLEQNFPNPFNPATNIRFTLPEETYVNLSIYDILGRQFLILAEGIRSKGQHTVPFDASTLNSGIYFYRLHAGNYSETKSMLLIK